MNLRVLHVVPIAPGGGTSGFIQRQIDCLSKEGVEGRVVFFGGSAMLFRPHRLPAEIAAICREIMHFQPDIVHAHWGSLLAFASAVASINGPPLVVSYRGSDINPVPSEARARNIIVKACSQMAALGTSAIICVSQELSHRLWSRRSDLHVICDGTDLSLFFPRDRVEARRILGWDIDMPVLLFNAGMSPQVKRIDLAEATEEVARRHLGRLRLEIIGGDIPYHEMPLRLNASDCLLVTSDFEGSPNIVREALACNTPVVSVPVGDVQLWLNGLEGTRIAERDPTVLGRAVADVILSGIRPNIGARAAAFSEGTVRDRILSVYRKVQYMKK